MPLTDKDILQILALVEGSSFDLLQLEYGDLKLTVSKSGRLPAEAMAKRDASASEERTSAPAPPVPSASATSAAPEHPARPASAPALVPVKAPVVGTFYAAPEPGASPFVSLGAAVEEDTTVGSAGRPAGSYR